MTYLKRTGKIKHVETKNINWLNFVNYDLAELYPESLEIRHLVPVIINIKLMKNNGKGKHKRRLKNYWRTKKWIVKFIQQ